MSNSTTGLSNYLRFNDSRCGFTDEDFNRILGQMQWWCEGVLFTGFGIIGLIANAVSILILSTKKMRKHCFNQLLIALAVFDMLFIVVSVPVYSFPLFNVLVGNKTFSLLYVHFLYPMSPVALCASIYMTLAVTVERYLAVCRPLVYRNLNMTMSSTKRVMMYVMPVMILSVCLNIPKFLETTTTTDGDNSTQIGIAEMRQDPTYMLYYTISQIFHPTLTTGIIPMAALIFMNWSIFKGIRRTITMRNQRRRGTTNPIPSAVSTADSVVENQTVAINTGRQQQQQQRKERSETNLAVVLIGIVLMHIACHTLRVFLSGVAVHLISDTVFCVTKYGGFVPPLWTLCAECVSSLLIMVNFSGNFLIYCSVLQEFKQTIWNLCTFCKINRSFWVTKMPNNPTTAADSVTMATGIDGNVGRRRLIACKKERTRAALIAKKSLEGANDLQVLNTEDV